MKLQKALKLKNTLAGEISSLQNLIRTKNSYIEGSSVDLTAFDTRVLFGQLLSKIEDLVNLKLMINDANEEIQAKIYTISEYKSLITFWNQMPTTSGAITSSSYAGTSVTNYIAQYSEVEKMEMIKKYQGLVDLLQEEIDQHNYTTEIPWEQHKAVIEK